MVLLGRDRENSQNALKKNLLPFGNNTPITAKVFENSPQINSISTSKKAGISKLPPLRQRNPLGSPISTSLNNKTSNVTEEYKASEPYGAPVIRSSERGPSE